MDLGAVGVDPDFAADHNFTGFMAHWNKNTNPAHAFDIWFLNLFPRDLAFSFNGGGYQTLSFIPSLATMIFGLLAGEWLRSGKTPSMKWLGLVMAGVALIVMGLALDLLGIVPIVKRIWTPSWAVYSAGWATVFLAFFYGVIDCLGFKGWAWPAVVVGLNSIAMYVMAKMLPHWIEETIIGLAGGDWILHVFDHLTAPTSGGGPATLAPIVEYSLVLLCLWFFCWLLYRSKIFIRI
jgi:predicted acyltransferase